MTEVITVPGQTALRHIGIIMDGNGRWAQKRGQLRTQGHLEGLKAAKRVVKAASEMGIAYLTLYTFSTENWKRTAEEVGFIMGLVKQYLRGELDFYRENSVRIRHAGSREGLPHDILAELDEACRETGAFNGLQVILALNYGGRQELLRGAKALAQRALAGEDPDKWDEDSFSDELYTSGMPEPDLLIRTGGDMRVSNFLLWQLAYAEIWYTDTYWPDFGEDDLREALSAFGKRQRRFGGV